jgi:hypothetical protein
MSNSTYWRERAEMCLRAAEQISLRSAAEKARADASAFLAKAEALEENTERAPSASTSKQQRE